VQHDLKESSVPSIANFIKATMDQFLNIPNGFLIVLIY
jgi:hypothetical protein